MKRRILLTLLLLSTLLGFLEWGENQKFIFEIEADIIGQIFNDPMSLLHPLIVLPFLGQILLIIQIIKKNWHKVLLYSSIAGMAIFFLTLLVVGIVSKNFKIAFSTLPFMFLTVMVIVNYRQDTKS